MAYLADRVKDTSTTTGTGSLTLAGSAPTGYQTFASAFGGGSTVVNYCIAGQGTSEWEVGQGTFNGTIGLTRTTVLASSNSNALVSFSAGTKDVFCTAPAAKIVDTDSNGQVIVGIKHINAAMNFTPSVPFTDFGGSTNGFLQFVMQNASTGTNASSDFVVTADTGNDTTLYGDFGINNSAYSQGTWTISGALDVYILASGNNLTAGTDTAGKTFSIHTGGTLLANVRMVFQDDRVSVNVPIENSGPDLALARGWAMS